MTDKEMAVNWIRSQGWSEETLPSDEFRQMFQAYLAGLKADRLEWHYVKDGDLPNAELWRVDVTVAYIDAYDNPCKKDCCFDGTDFVYWDDRNPVGWKKVDIFGKVYAWKYPEKLPELPRDS